VLVHCATCRQHGQGAARPSHRPLSLQATAGRGGAAARACLSLVPRCCGAGARRCPAPRAGGGGADGALTGVGVRPFDWACAAPQVVFQVLSQFLLKALSIASARCMHNQMLRQLLRCAARGVWAGTVSCQCCLSQAEACGRCSAAPDRLHVRRVGL
jgi:hypothetical protein